LYEVKTFLSSKTVTRWLFQN